MDETGERNWAADFARTFAAPPSRVFADAGKAVLGAEYPAELTPFSGTTWSELHRIAAELHVNGDDLLMDVGCGHGGPGLWLAATTGARYFAVDINEPALAAVTARATALGLSHRVSTAVGSFEQLPASTASVDAVASIEAFLFVSNKAAAAAEVARVLRPGGRLVMVNYDYRQEMTPGRPPQLRDHRPLLAGAGFEVLVYEETPQWRERLRGVYQIVAARLEERARELDMDPELVRRDLDLAREGAELMTRRVLIVAERR